MPSEEIINGVSIGDRPTKLKQIKPKNPLRMDRYAIILNSAVIPIHALNAYFEPSIGWALVYLIFVVYSVKISHWSYVSIQKTKKKDSYSRYLVENHIYKVFFGKADYLDAPEVNFNVKTKKYWEELYVKDAMLFSDHKKFNKKGYLEYQLHKE